MPPIKTSLTPIICGSTILSVTHAAQDQLIRVPSPTTNVAEPPINEDDLALLILDGRLSELSEAELLRLGFKFKCLGVILKLGGCIGDIVKGIIHHDYSGVGTKCCNAILDPRNLKCLFTGVYRDILTKFLHIPDHLKILEQICASIPAEAMYNDKKIGEFLPNAYSSLKDLKD
ncbi:hypothetical protein ACFE04_030267 [Oxalis oulophora]